MKHYNIRVKGRVQGVGFRYSAMKAARSFNLNGFVRNEQDGSVYMEAEGDDLSLELLLDWCRRGPGHSRVDDVIHSESGFRGFQEFGIAH